MMYNRLLCLLHRLYSSVFFMSLVFISLAQQPKRNEKYQSISAGSNKIERPAYGNQNQQTSALWQRTNDGTIERLQISLYYTDPQLGRRITDGIAVKFSNTYSAAVASEDAIKFSNFDEEVGILRDGIKLSIEGRPLIDDKDTLPIYIARLKQQVYEWQFDPSSFNAPGLQAILQDNFLNIQTLISLSAQSKVSFTVTSNTASSISNRFRIIFNNIADYRSNGNVNISSAINWLQYNGTVYTTATVPPSIADIIMVQSGHTLTIDQNFTIGNGKALLLEPTSKLVIAPSTILNIAGSADFNGQAVTIKSTSDGSGSLGPLSSTGSNVTGATEVTVERFISGAGNRAYRQLASVVNTSTSIKPYIKDNWQEGMNNANTASNSNPLPGYGTHITGSKTGANGFDATQTGNPSLYTLQNGTTWQVISNTDFTSLNAKTGFLIFVRGDRSVNLNSNLSNSNTTLRTTGSLLLGDQTYSGLTANQYNFITNPFASAINWGSVYTGNGGTNTFATTDFVYYDPNINTRGSYVTVQTDGTVIRYNGSSFDLNALNIQSGQAFWIKPTTTSVVIHESDKSAVNNRDVFRSNDGTIERLQMSLFYNDAQSGRRIADGIATKFGNDYSAAIGAEDATKFSNFDEEVAILRDGQKLSIEGRPLIDQEDTLPIFMAKMKEQAYEWQFDPTNFSAPGLQAYLQDKYLNIETAISLADQTIIPFNITINTTSAASDRFRVVFRNITVLPINFTNVKAFEKGNNIQVEWNLGNEQNMKQYEIEKSIDGRTFTKAGMQTARATMSADNYQYLDQQPNIGNNFYRIKAIEKGGTFKYSQVVNVKVGKGNSAITVYPNPVTDNVISLQLVNQPKGKYSIRLLNQLGQEVYRKELNHIGGSATETLQLNKKIASGLYNLQVNGTSVLKVIKVRVG